MYQRFQWSYSNIQFFHGFVPQNREQFKPKSEGNNSRALFSASSSFLTSVPTSHSSDAGHPQVPQTHHHLLPISLILSQSWGQKASFKIQNIWVIFPFFVPQVSSPVSPRSELVSKILTRSHLRSSHRLSSEMHILKNVHCCNINLHINLLTSVSNSSCSVLI